MNEELKKALLDLASGVKEVGTQAILFGKEQIPDVLQQLVTYKLIVACFYIVLGIFLISVACIGTKKVFSIKATGKYTDGSSWGTGSSSMNGLSQSQIYDTVTNTCKDFYRDVACCEPDNHTKYVSSAIHTNHGYRYGQCKVQP